MKNKWKIKVVGPNEIEIIIRDRDGNEIGIHHSFDEAVDICATILTKIAAKRLPKN